MMHYDEDGSARRIFQQQRSVGSGQWSVVSGEEATDEAEQYPPTLRLSEAAVRFLCYQRNVCGNAPRTIDEYETAIWYLIEFAAADSPIGQLDRQRFGRRWMEWLRTTPQQPYRPWSRPRQITPATVAAFLQWKPPRGQPGAPRDEQTLGRYWRQGRRFLAAIGVSTKLPRAPRGTVVANDYAPETDEPRPLTVDELEIAEWWRETLDPSHGHARMTTRRRVVLMQALALLTGCRIGELLAARMELSDGHWLLLHKQAVKTRRARLIYISRQALAIARTLRRWTVDGQGTLFDFKSQSDFFAGWPYTESHWQKQVSSCLPPRKIDDQGEAQVRKRHQELRKVASTWLNRRDPDVEKAQLGHGALDVVSAHYLDVLSAMPDTIDFQGDPETLPRMSRFGPPMPLPQLPGFCWPAPIDAVPRKVSRMLHDRWRKRRC
jgi:integrase